MSTETAQTVMAAIGAVGALVWLCGALFLLASARTGGGAPAHVPDHFGHLEPPPRGWFLGSVEVPGEPRALAAKADALLTKGGALRVTERGGDRLEFEQVGPGALLGWGIRRGRLQFTGLGGGRTRIDYAAEPAVSGVLLGIGWLLQGLGLVALVGGGWLVYSLAATSPEPAVRWQTFQYVQIVHFLWPPFLFGGLNRTRRRILVGSFALALSNLPEVRG